MSRMVVILCALALALASAPAAVHAGVAEESIVEQLKDQGFKRMRITRTLLGRTRIVATSAEIRREIVVNPATGEILRDYSVRRADGTRSSPRLVNPFAAARQGTSSGGAAAGPAGGTGAQPENGEDAQGDGSPEDEDEDDESEDAGGGGDDAGDAGDSGGDDDEADTD